jgi:hypothetical protein
LHGPEGNRNGAARAGGFSLHAGINIQPGQRAKLERLCRYVSRPPVVTERLAMTSSGQVRCQLKTPYRDGITHIVMEPLDLMARLAATRMCYPPYPPDTFCFSIAGVDAEEFAAALREAFAAAQVCRWLSLFVCG